MFVPLCVFCLVGQQFITKIIRQLYEFTEFRRLFSHLRERDLHILLTCIRPRNSRCSQHEKCTGDVLTQKF